MKINPSQIAKAMEIYRTQKPAASRIEKEKKHKKDELVLSDRAQAFQLALQAIQKDDDLDIAKVEKIRKQLAEGQYSINPREIADKIVDDLLSKKRV